MIPFGYWHRPARTSGGTEMRDRDRILPPRGLASIASHFVALRPVTDSDQGLLKIVIHDAIHPVATPLLLSRLGDRLGQMAVCVVGAHAARWPELLREYIVRRATPVFHGYTHRASLRITRRGFAKELQLTEQVVRVVQDALNRPEFNFAFWTPPGGMTFGSGWVKPRTGLQLRSATLYRPEFSLKARNYRQELVKPVLERLRRDGGGELFIHASRIRYRRGHTGFLDNGVIYWSSDAIRDIADGAEKSGLTLRGY